MNKEQILKKLIEKVYTKGMKINDIEMWETIDILHVFGNGYFDYMDKGNKEFGHINEILFDHSFAKAFWGKGLHTSGTDEWRWHISELALVKDRLEYMKQFIRGD